jgi:hypothetical protein
MYYLVSVDHNSLAACITRSDSEVCCISSAVYGTDDDMLWNGNEEMKRLGMLGVSVRETVTLIDKGS